VGLFPKCVRFFVHFILFNHQAPEIIIFQPARNEATGHSNHNRPYCQPQYAWWWRVVHSAMNCLRRVEYRRDQQITGPAISIVREGTIYRTLPSRRILKSWQLPSWPFNSFKQNPIYFL